MAALIAQFADLGRAFLMPDAVQLAPAVLVFSPARDPAAWSVSIQGRRPLMVPMAVATTVDGAPRLPGASAQWHGPAAAPPGRLA